MLWQKIKSAAQWLVRKIAAGLRWFGIKLGIIAPSFPVIDVSTRTKPLLQQPSEPQAATVQQHLSISPLSSSYEGKSQETTGVIPSFFLRAVSTSDVLLHIRSFLTHRDYACINQVLGRNIYDLQELKESSQNHSTAIAVQATSVSTTAFSGTLIKGVRDFSYSRQFKMTTYIGRLLKATEYADYEQVEQMIAYNSSLMFESVNYVFRDGSSERISPLKCAFKLYDTYMWKIFYEKIEKEADPKLRQQYIRQMLEQANTRTKNIMIGLQPFLAYKKNVKQFQLGFDKEIIPKKLEKKWFKLGTAQKKMLPVHMLKEFSREGDTWSADSNFDVNVTPRPTSCCTYDYITGDRKSLSSTLSDLGCGSFSLVRGHRSLAPLRVRLLFEGSLRLSVLMDAITGVQFDLEVFCRLFEVRIQDFFLMMQNLLANQEQQNRNAVMVNPNRVAP